MSGAAAGGSAVASFLSALMQYESSEAARRMSVSERKKLEGLIRDVQEPGFDFSRIDPEAYKVVARYQPQVADFVTEQAPQLTRLDSEGARMAREAQREALGRMRAQASGQDPLGDAELQQALSQAAVANRGRTDAVREDFARRGQGGGAAEMLAQLVGTQQANQQASDGSRAAYIEAQRRRLQSIRDSAGLAGQIGDDEYRLEQGNNDLINSYNQRFAANRQGWANGVANTMNEGQRFNITNEQDVANKNTSTANSFKVNERNREDDLFQRDFDNQLGKVKVQAGITDMARSDALGAGRDRNNAISGANDGVQTAIAYSQSAKGQQQAAPAQQNVWAGAPEEDYSNPLNRKYRTGRAQA